MSSAAVHTKDHGPAAASGCVYAAGSVLLFFGIAMACNFAGMPERWRIGVLILLITAIPLLAIAIRVLRLRRALGRAELDVPSPMKPGQSATAIYTRPLHNATLESVDVRLLCENKVVYGYSGGRGIWIPVRHVLHEQTITARLTPGQDRIEIHIPVHVPANAVPSTPGPRASVTWWLQLRLHMGGCPDTTSSFMIDVVAAPASK